MLNNGDKLVVVKKVASFLDEGDIAKVVNVNEDGIITFAFGDNFVHMGVMSHDEAYEHFEVMPEKTAPTITQEHIDEIMNNSTFDVETMFHKCTIVACKLPNGFVIVESSACVSPENYDEKMGFDICMKKIKDKVWELEGYRLQSEIYEMNKSDCDKCDYEDCDCYNCEDYDDCEEPYCDFCDDCECPCHPNH